MNLVTVPVVVTDEEGRILTGLRQDNFEVFEDKVRQAIKYFSSDDIPASVGVVFDVSGSMKDKIPVARDAAVTFLKSGNPEDEYFLMQFSSRPQLTADFTADVSKLQNKIVFTRADGMTAMYDAVYMALEKLKEASNPRKALLLITDGEDNHSRYTANDIRDFIKEQDVQIYTIGIVDSWNSELAEGRSGRDMLTELADISGGQAFFPDSVYELDDMCGKIAAELKDEYVIGYQPTNRERDGRWRKIHVRIDPPRGLSDLSVHSKSGYYAANL